MNKLSDIMLINPLHLKLVSDGYGEFPNGYKFTEKGIEYLKEVLFDNIIGEIELSEEPKEYSSNIILKSIKILINQL